MNIEEIRARESLISRLTCFMNGGYTPYDTIRSMCQDSINTINRLTSELEQKNRELAQLAIESIEREKQSAKLEAEVQHWADAEKDGRLVMLPCKVGTTVYEATYFGVIECCVTTSDIDEFGKTIFLTREEAEAALSALGGGVGDKET